MLNPSDGVGPGATGRSGPDPAALPRGESAGLLVVDDDEGVLWYLEQALTRDGYRVFPAGDVSGAVALFRRQAGLVRAALLDVSMPGGGGCEVLRELRLLRPGLPAVFMSGDLDPDLSCALADHLRRAGADGLIAKPMRPGDLRAAVAAAVAGPCTGLPDPAPV